MERVGDKQSCGWFLGCRRTIAWLAAGLVVVAFLAVMSYDPSTPRYLPADRHRLTSATSLGYNFLSERPFAGGRVWLTLAAGNTDGEAVLFDLETKSVVGRLKNGFPVQSDPEGSYVLCSTRIPRKLNVLQRFQLLVNKGCRQLGLSALFTLRSARGVGRIDDENFWILDLRTGKADFVGTISQHSGLGSMFRFSPDFQFAVNKSSQLIMTNVSYLLDVQQRVIREIKMDGQPVGWWDNETIMLSRSTNVYLVGLDGTERLLVGKAAIESTLASYETEMPNLTPFGYWSGDRFDFFLTDGHKRWSAEESVLLRITRPDGQLELVSPRFKFEWGDRFDEEARHYVFTGRVAGDRSDAVIVRDLVDGQERTLVPSAGTKTFSTPNFYADTILYVRSNQLWSINVDGSANELIFPPAAIDRDDTDNTSLTTENEARTDGDVR